MQKTVTLTTIVILCLANAPSFGQQSTEATQEGTTMAQIDPVAGTEESGTEIAPNPVVLRVNGDPIYAIEISMVMQTVQAQLIERGEEVDPRELAKVATQRAVEQKLLVQEARRFGIEVDELEVARSAQQAEQQAGGRAMLEARLKSSGSTYDQFLNIIRELELMRGFVIKQIRSNVVVTDEEIAAYYAANPELFEAEDRVHAFHMIFIIGEDADPAALAATKAKADAAHERAVSGEEDFATIARELSQGPSAPTGGDLGWVTRGALVSPLSETIFALQPGEISPVVQSRFGFHVATITDRRPAETISLEDASAQITDFLEQQKTTETVGELLQTLVKNAKVDNLLGAGTPGPGTGLN